jgi:AmmeMemoRadiSam system protein B
MSKSIKTFSRKQIEEGLSKFTPDEGNRVRILFAQSHINEQNFSEACRLYSSLQGAGYDDVVIIEKYPGSYDKLIPLISNAAFETPIGEVPANDMLRNDFCDEDDDFYLDDSGYTEDMALFDQLMMLQCAIGEFRAVSIQLVDMRGSIIRELASGVGELIRDRNALVVICADASASDSEKLEKLQQTIDQKEISRMMNFLSTGDAGIDGAGPLCAGVLIANEWELETRLEPDGSGFLYGHSRLYHHEKSAAR